MAFITATPSFLGTRVQNREATCAKAPRRAAVRMTAVSPTPELAASVDDGDPNYMSLPRFTVQPLRKGQPYSFVRFFKDDFEPSPYFNGLTGNGVRVAVLDTGCDASHPAFANRIDRNASRNYTTDPGDWSNDGNGHGTHCAGIIGAQPIQKPMYGVAPGVELVIKKTLTNRGSGNLAWLPAAIRDAANENCRVISMSLGAGNRRLLAPVFAEIYEACTEAMAKGVVLVAAAGNAGTFNRDNTISVPGSFGGLITVASHDDAGVKSAFSSFGGELDFMAPGEVVSTWPLNIPKRRSQDSAVTEGLPGYANLQGTSMATPLVAGLAALLIEAADRVRTGNFGSMSRALVRDINRSGFGARNCYEVHEMLRGLSESPNEHNRRTGYGRLVRAYQYVRGEVLEDI